LELRKSQQRAQIVEGKWRRVTNGGSFQLPKNRQGFTAQLLEEQTRYLKEDCCDINGFSTTQLAAYEKQSIGMIKRVYHRLIAPDIVGTQPMPGPVSLAIFFRHRYGNKPADNKDILEPGGINRIWRNGVDPSGIAAEMDPYYSLLSVTAATVTNETYTLAAAGPLTQSSLIDTFLLCDGLTANPGIGVLGGSVTLRIIAGGGTGTITLGFGSNVIDVTGTYVLPAPPVEGPAGTVGPLEIRTFVDGTDVITFEVTYTVDAVGAVTDVTFTATVTNVSGNEATDFEVEFTEAAVFQNGFILNRNCVSGQNGVCGPNQNVYENLPAKDLTFEICKVPFAPVTRKLRTNWSLEAIQDLKNLYNMDPDAVLTEMAVAEISMEIDREILGDLLSYAAHRATWYTKPPVFAAGSSPALHMTPTEWYQTLMHVVSDISASIYKATRRAKANFIVTDPFTASFLEKMNDFVANVDMDMGDVGIMKVGTMSGRYKVYVDPLFPRGKMLIGYKGSNEYDTGYVYAPYQPITLTPVVHDPCTFQAFKGIFTRYGKVLTLDGCQYYGVIDLIEDCDLSFQCA